MDESKTKKIADYIFEEVFGRKNPFTLPELQEKFALDIPSAKKVKSLLSDEYSWTISGSEERIASQESIKEQFKKNEWIMKKTEINSIDDILKAWKNINYITGERYINSQEVSESDGIYNSNSIYKSVSIFDSKNIINSYKIFDCNYMLASRDNSSCTLGIRLKENIFCSSGFEISWSNKVSRSMYIHDSYDLFECLFCSHLRSKKYCIANMQFEKEEYFVLKEKVLDWILKD